VAVDGGKAVLPWYRHFFVWLLIAFPALSVAGGVAMLLVAANTNDGLVVDDYYRQGLEINRRMERDRNAASAGLRAGIEFDPAAGHLRVRLRANAGFHSPARLRMSFMHPTRAGRDQTVDLGRVAPMVYEGPLPDLEGARWYALIEADDWRLLESVDRR
jgi:hypothetical protein